MTNPRVSLQRSDDRHDRAQRQNPSHKYHDTPQGVKRLPLSSQAETNLKEKAAEAGISRKFKFYANVS